MMCMQNVNQLFGDIQLQKAEGKGAYTAESGSLVRKIPASTLTTAYIMDDTTSVVTGVQRIIRGFLKQLLVRVQ